MPPSFRREGSAVTVRVMQTDEDLMIARHTRELLTIEGGGRSSRVRVQRNGRFFFRRTSGPIYEGRDDGKARNEPSGEHAQVWAGSQLPHYRPDLLAGEPRLGEPLRLEHIKPRLLGHGGTSPGLSWIYVHLNRLIQGNTGADVIYLTGPGHGGPAIVA